MGSRFPHLEKSTLRIRVKNLKLSAPVILPSIGLGVSPFIMQFTESVISVCFNTSLQKYGGDIAVGAMAILTSVMQFCMLPLQGLTQGAQPIISFNYGAGKLERVKKAFRLLLAASLCYSTFLWAICMFSPGVYRHLHQRSGADQLYCLGHSDLYGRIAAFRIQIACQQTFIALGNAITSVFLALLRKVLLLIPLIFILPLFLTNKPFGVFLAEPVADTIAVTVTGLLFLRQYRKLSVGSGNTSSIENV